MARARRPTVPALPDELATFRRSAWWRQGDTSPADAWMRWACARADHEEASGAALQPSAMQLFEAHYRARMLGTGGRLAFAVAWEGQSDPPAYPSPGRAEP
jgi:hypothetical protein